ncbi:MAG: hypothetical protein WDO73_15495 [Ignavibacteriota bacterium]
MPTARLWNAIRVSAYGGVIGINRTVDEETARELAKLFVEAVAAPDYSPEALAILTGRKNLRVMRVGTVDDPLVVKSISGGYLAQTADRATLDRRTGGGQVAAPADGRRMDGAGVRLEGCQAREVERHRVCRPGQVVGVGAGQMSRVDSARFGAMKAILPLARHRRGGRTRFFPFPDGLEEAANHGATAFIEPGGSVRDADVIAAADRLGAALVFTGWRHFRH